MTDFVVNTAATAVAKVAVSEIVSHFRGEYDEQQVKEQILLLPLDEENGKIAKSIKKVWRCEK